MAGDFTGKTVLITGAGGGIGRATALLIASQGGYIVATDNARPAVDETMRLIKDAGGDSFAIQADLTIDAEVDAIVPAVIAERGRLDCAFNNAGITASHVGQGGRKLADWDDDAFDKVVSVNLRGVFKCMKAEINQMQSQGGGTIVNAASASGLRGFKFLVGYVASKHGVVGMTKTAAAEYAPTIRANAIAPGYVATDLTKDVMERMGDEVLERMPFHRMADAKEVGELVAWLLSDKSSYVSGSTYQVDGALLA